MAISGYNTGSPGVKITETVEVGTVTSQSVTVGAIVGNFGWGAVESITMVSDEDSLRKYFYLPDDTNYKDWFSAYNFLCYSQDLRVVRVVGDTAKNACDVPGEAVLIKTNEHFSAIYSSLIGKSKRAKVFAKYPGTYGNSFRVVIEDYQRLQEEDSVLKGFVNQIITEDNVAFAVMINGEMQEFRICSFSEKSKTYTGDTNYLISAVNNNSNYVYLIKEQLITHDSVTNERNKIAVDVTLSGGTSGTVSDGNYINGWKLFDDPDATDVGLLIQGGASAVIGKYMIENVAENRQDAIACVSPSETSVVNILDGTQTNLLSNDSATLGYSQYRFMDGNYKYQYDHINDVYRWVPLNGDIAGVFSEVDNQSAPWYSPGGRSIKNVVKLAFYPTKAQRDELYKYRINPVTSFKDTGHILYGDWTGADVNNPFNFVNVRRMFNYIEKSIVGFARKILYQQNDEITQTSFYQSVDPFLREVQGGRGIENYKIICDGTVNTADVVRAGKFMAKIYVQSVFSVRWVEINFINTHSSTNFEESII